MKHVWYCIRIETGPNKNSIRIYRKRSNHTYQTKTYVYSVEREYTLKQFMNWKNWEVYSPQMNEQTVMLIRNSK